MNTRIATMLAAVIAGCVWALALGATAQAHTTSVYHGGTYFGSVVVEPGQVVDGDLNVVFGNATIEGTVQGDVDVVDGSAYIAPGAAVTGHINAVGGDVTQTVVPWAPDQDVSGDHDSHLFWKLGVDAIVLLLFLIFPARVRMALGRLEEHPGLSAVAGVIGWIAVIPLGVVLVCTFILAPLILVEGIALLAGSLIGTAAVSLLVGRRLAEMLHTRATPTPLTALVLGLALVTAAEMVPFIGGVVGVLVVVVGLGAVILTFFREHTFLGAAIPPQSRPPMSGPPMTVA